MSSVDHGGLITNSTDGSYPAARTAASTSDRICSVAGQPV